MLIFIPMSGFGSRYIRAGYREAKPLIPVDGRPMIERVVDCFPRHAKFLFAVNRTHAETTDVLRTLEGLGRDHQTVVIEPHKDGPVRTVLDVRDHLPKDEPVCLNYCDFGVDWDFDAFERWLEQGDFQGAMTAYRGFHPHNLGPTLYAFMRTSGDQVLEIREKHAFTDDKMNEYASSGLYWFRRGADLIRFSEQLVAGGERVNGEFYVSMVMQELIESGGSCGVYPLDHFYQWGTPEDLRDYEGWARAMRAFPGMIEAAAESVSPASQVVPMAGHGKRFSERGYSVPKPLIETAGRPMIAQALATLPRPTRRVLIAQAEHAEDPRFSKVAGDLSPPPVIRTVDAVTEGQACTAALGMPDVELDAPVLFAPCDAAYVYSLERWAALEANPGADLIVWAARGHLPALWRPQMYGWLALDDEDRIVDVAVKKPVEGVPIADQAAVTGTFWFAKGARFMEELDAMIADDDRVNGEFYIDTLARRIVKAKGAVRAFVVDKWIPFGTPEELMTFHYWNEVFRRGERLG